MADNGNAQAEQPSITQEQLQAALRLIESRKEQMSLSMPGKLWLAVQAEAQDKGWASPQEMCMVIIAERLGLGDDPCMADAKGKRKYASEEERKAAAKAAAAQKRAEQKAAIDAFRAAQKSKDVNALRGWLTQTEAASEADLTAAAEQGEAITGGTKHA